MDPRIFLGIAAFIVFVVLVVVGGRRAAAGDRRLLAGAIYLPLLVGGPVMIWAGARTVGTSLPVGLVLMAIGAVTTILVGRVFVDGVRSGSSPAISGELRGPYFDYLMWTMIGAPFILVALLLILAVTGGLTSH